MSGLGPDHRPVTTLCVPRPPSRSNPTYLSYRRGPGVGVGGLFCTGVFCQSRGEGVLFLEISGRKFYIPPLPRRDPGVLRRNPESRAGLNSCF